MKLIREDATTGSLGVGFHRREEPLTCHLFFFFFSASSSSILFSFSCSKKVWNPKI